MFVVRSHVKVKSSYYTELCTWKSIPTLKPQIMLLFLISFHSYLIVPYALCLPSYKLFIYLSTCWSVITSFIPFYIIYIILLYLWRFEVEPPWWWTKVWRSHLHLQLLRLQPDLYQDRQPRPLDYGSDQGAVDEKGGNSSGWSNFRSGTWSVSG